ADIKHRRFVAFALADHHGAVDRQRVERLAHCFHRGVVGSFLVTAPNLARCGNRGGFGNAHRFERKNTVERLAHLPSPQPLLIYPIPWESSWTRPALRPTRQSPSSRAARPVPSIHA